MTATTFPDAFSHLSAAFAGPADLRLMLAEVRDRSARLIAADRMDDYDRPLEAAMLRDPKHPLLAVGGGVFYAPGHAWAVGNMTVGDADVRAADWPAPRVVQASSDEYVAASDRASQHLSFCAFDHLSDGTSLIPRGGDPWAPYAETPVSVATKFAAVAREVRRHQTSAEDGEHLALSAGGEAVILAHARKYGPPLVIDRWAFACRRGGRFSADLWSHAGEAPQSRRGAMTAEMTRRRKAGLSFRLMDTLPESHRHSPRARSGAASMLEWQGWLRDRPSGDGERFLAPSRRHLRLFRESFAATYRENSDGPASLASM